MGSLWHDIYECNDAEGVANIHRNMSGDTQQWASQISDAKVADLKKEFEGELKNLIQDLVQEVVHDPDTKAVLSHSHKYLSSTAWTLFFFC